MFEEDEPQRTEQSFFNHEQHKIRMIASRLRPVIANRQNYGIRSPYTLQLIKDCAHVLETMGVVVDRLDELLCGKVDEAGFQRRLEADLDGDIPRGKDWNSN